MVQFANDLESVMESDRKEFCLRALGLWRYGLKKAIAQPISLNGPNSHAWTMKGNNSNSYGLACLLRFRGEK